MSPSRKALSLGRSLGLVALLGVTGTALAADEPSRDLAGALAVRTLSVDASR